MKIKTIPLLEKPSLICRLTTGQDAAAGRSEHIQSRCVPEHQTQ